MVVSRILALLSQSVSYGLTGALLSNCPCQLTLTTVHSKAVITRGVVVKEHLALVHAKMFGNLAKSRVEGVEVAVEFVHGKIAGEHASENTKGLNGLKDKRANAFDSPVPVHRPQP